MKGGDIELKPGIGEDGVQAPSIRLCADGTFWIGDREIETDEELRDLFASFVRSVKDGTITIIYPHNQPKETT